jgi:hypothetical protein
MRLKQESMVMPESKPSTTDPVSNPAKSSPKTLKVAFYVLLSLILFAVAALFLIILTKLPGTF